MGNEKSVWSEQQSAHKLTVRRQAAMAATRSYALDADVQYPHGRTISGRTSWVDGQCMLNHCCCQPCLISISNFRSSEHYAQYRCSALTSYLTLCRLSTINSGHTGILSTGLRYSNLCFSVSGNTTGPGGHTAGEKWQLHFDIFLERLHRVRQTDAVIFSLQTRRGQLMTELVACPGLL